MEYWKHPLIQRTLSSIKNFAGWNQFYNIFCFEIYNFSLWNDSPNFLSLKLPHPLFTFSENHFQSFHFEILNNFFTLLMAFNSFYIFFLCCHYTWCEDFADGNIYVNILKLFKNFIELKLHTRKQSCQIIFIKTGTLLICKIINLKAGFFKTKDWHA